MNELREKLIEALAKDCFDRRFGPGSWDQRDYYREKYRETAAADLDHLLDLLTEHKEAWKIASQDAWMHAFGDVEHVTSDQIAIMHIEALRETTKVALVKTSE